MKRDSFIFYGSFREAARALDDATRLALYDAIADYGLYDEMPEDASPLVQALFTLIRPQLEANARRREAGRMGGRPTRESRDPQTPSSGSSGTAELPSAPKAAPAEKPVDTVLSCHAKPVVSDPVQKQKPNVNANENVNANVNKNINVHANADTTAHDRQRPEQRTVLLPASARNFSAGVCEAGAECLETREEAPAFFENVPAASREKKEQNGLPQRLDFERFWETYPVKARREQAQKAFARLKLSPEEGEKLLEDVALRSRRLEEAARQGGFFPSFPNPANYLREKRWAEPLPLVKPPPGKATGHHGYAEHTTGMDLSAICVNLDK